MDEIIDIRFINPGVKYGAFAKEDLPADFVLGEYTGIFKNRGESTDYAWRYQSDMEPTLNVDSKHIGNMLRYVNDLDDYNCTMKSYYFENAWHVMYVTT